MLTVLLTYTDTKGKIEMLKNFLARKQNGFTIVELIIAVVTIGIFAGMMISASNNYLQRAAEHSAKNSLIAASAEMKKVHNKTGEYPSSLSQNVALSGIVVNVHQHDAQTFCVRAVSEKYADIAFHMVESDRKTQQGMCPGSEGSGD